MMRTPRLFFWAVLALAALLALAGCAGEAPVAPSPTPAEPGRHAWSVGDDGTILATDDFGAHWRVQRAGSADGRQGLMAVAFSDAAHGWAVGNVILATTDGGATWTAQSMPAGVAGLTGVATTDAEHAWACGHMSRSVSVIIATDDGGATWRVQYEGRGGSSDLFAIAFADPLHGWAVGDDGVVATSDGGASWEVQKTVSAVTGLMAVSCADAQRVWVGGSYGGGADYMFLLSTTDGGATWTTRRWPRYGAVYGLTTLGSSRVWCTSSDRVMSSTDGGSTWRRTDVFRDAGVYALAFATPRLGWAVGSEWLPGSGWSNGVILATTDGGLHWTTRRRVAGFSLSDVATAR